MNAPPREAGDAAGFTLIELMISLGLFALIAVAGLAMLESILGVRERTEVRLDRLSQLQRATYVVASDIDQIARGPISGGPDGLEFTRAAPGVGGPPVALGYRVVNGALVRSIDGLPQLVLPDVVQVRWRFWDGEWSDRWPRDGAAVADWPQAVDIEVELAGPAGPRGALRRLVTLPARIDDAQ